MPHIMIKIVAGAAVGIIPIGRGMVDRAGGGAQANDRDQGNDQGGIRQDRGGPAGGPVARGKRKPARLFPESRCSPGGKKIRVTLERREDGGLRVYSADLPGLVLLHSDARGGLSPPGRLGGFRSAQ